VTRQSGQTDDQALTTSMTITLRPDRWLTEGDEIEAAYRLAQTLHRGQVDKRGRPYIIHPVAVARIVRRAGGTRHQIAAALLHDTIEDTGITAEQLLALGFHPHTVAIVAAVSKPPIGVTYRTFIALIPVIEPEAVLVKLADLMHNTDPRRPVIDEHGRPLPPAAHYLAAITKLGPYWTGRPLERNG